MDWSCDQLSERERYRLLVNTVLPRPIALVTSCDQQGRVNTAPFSFFNVMGSAPAVLALGLENDAHSADGLKDTTRNILATGQFVVNLI
ncbi:MAG: flavin reductase family protein, partial [Alcaligenes aquatilis]